MLQIGNQKYYGVNAHGQSIALKPSNGWIARSSVHHAEGDVFNQVLKDGVINKYARLFVDKELCKNCKSIAGVIDFARQVGIERLDIITQNGIRRLTIK